MLTLSNVHYIYLGDMQNAAERRSVREIECKTLFFRPLLNFPFFSFRITSKKVNDTAAVNYATSLHRKPPKKLLKR